MSPGDVNVKWGFAYEDYISPYFFVLEKLRNISQKLAKNILV